MPTSRTARRAGATLAALAGGYYLNDRFGFTHDLRTLAQDRRYSQTIAHRLSQLGHNVTPYRMLELANPGSAALWFEGRQWTYAELKMDVDAFAAILQERKISVGDSVAVFMSNSPEMLIAFYAVTKLGAVPAMLNSSLRSQTLEHCLAVANAKLIICTANLVQVILNLKSSTAETTGCISLNLLSYSPVNLPSSHEQIDYIRQVSYADFAAMPQNNGPSNLPRRTPADSGVLIYTSGTSGNPKAVNVKNMLLVIVSTPIPADTGNISRYFPLRTYSCLPLFHGTCLFAGLMYSVGNSSCFCLSRKFSASRFSRELVEAGATRLLYVGELCRYALLAPPSPHDRKHAVTVAYGNGMAADVWLKFRARFSIHEIREIYRATEAIAKYDNFTTSGTFAGGAGHVGREGVIRRWLEDDVFIVRYDAANEQPWRDPQTGFCIRVTKNNEPGEVIGRVRNPATYNEYLDNEPANAAKLLRDVFREGDVFQRTGDLLARDSKGWISFVDRTGDTYRWRGENVSAGEVRAHISRIPGVADCAVWGVKLSKYDGRCGAACITISPLSSSNSSSTPSSSSTSPSTDSLPANEDAGKFMADLCDHLRRSGLTPYQLPRLIRITNQPLATGATFKHAKEVMKLKSWDPQHADNTNTATATRSESEGESRGGGGGGEEETKHDQIYWLKDEGNSSAGGGDSTNLKYELLRPADWERIQSGKARL